MNDLYAIVDIETTGGHAHAHGITEIAIFIHDGHTIVDHFETLINPFQEIPLFIQGLTGITNEMVSKAPSFETVAAKIFKLLDQKVFVAHNVNFDFSFVHHHLKKTGFQLQCKKLCTVRMARKIFPGLPSYSLGKLVRSFNITITNRHRAGGDAFATATLFKMLLDADEHQHIKEALSAKTKEHALPSFISREEIDKIPKQPGVYYFKNKKDKIIYVGKAKNLYKRILSHFSNNSPHKNKQAFLREIRKISHQVCGTELQALILENIEIKRLWPTHNKAAKTPERRFALYIYEDQNGFIRLNIGKKVKNVAHFYLFGSLVEAQQWVQNICITFNLCFKLCGGHKNFEACLVHHCSVCIGNETYKTYNDRVNQTLLILLKELPSYLIIDDGRNSFEKSCILMDKGSFYGMGYFNENQIPDNLSDAKEKLTPYPSHQFIEKIINDFALQYPQKQIVLRT